MIQRTFSIIKPDAVKSGNTGAILAEIEKGEFKIVSIRKQSISKKEAEGFYAVHAAKGFFDSLTTFMSSGPLVLLVLEKDECGRRHDS
jgi:nucleoside-diphosphate kinase